MADPVVISTSELFRSGASGDVDLSVTVPTGCNACIIGGTFYKGSAITTTLSGTGWLTVQGSDTYDGIGGGSYGFMGGYSARGKVTATGSRTLRFNSSGDFDEGPTCIITWLTVDNPDDWELDFSRDNHVAVPESLSATVDSETNGLVIAYLGKDGSNGSSPPATPSGTTSLATQGQHLGDYQRVVEVDSPGASTTTVTMASLDYPTLFVVSVKAGAGGGGITGSLSATESGADVLAASGTVLVSGSLAGVESGSDTASVAGSVLVSGALSASEAGADTASISGAVLVQGSLSATEAGDDTFAAIGTVGSVVTGSLTAVETGPDTAAVSGAVLVSGALAAVEAGSDIAAVFGSVAVSGSVSAVETGQDQFSAVGVASSITGSLNAVEQGSDTAQILGEGVTLDQPRTAGFVITDTAPRMWWQRKPKALDEKEAKQLVERVVRVVERIARTQVEQPKPAPQKVRKAEVRDAIAPLVDQMPGFDWMAVYRAILIELERRKQEEQARELAAAEIARIRAIEQDDEDVLLLLMSL